MKIFKKILCSTLLALNLIGHSQANDQQQIKQGKYLYELSGCTNCHTLIKTLPNAGGKAIETDFGTFYAPNITPSKKFGIGNWSDKDFLRALRKGKSPQGQPYYPSFPYTSYSKLTDADILAIKAYLGTFPAIDQEVKPHELKGLYKNRSLLHFWRALNFRPFALASKKQKQVFKYRGALHTNRRQSEAWNRGAYLVEAALHCTECHTPRSRIGGLKAKQWMAGNYFIDDQEIAANLTSDIETGLGKWTAQDWEKFLRKGENPQGDGVGGEMKKIIKQATAQLTDEDMGAVIKYLMSLAPVSHLPQSPPVDEPNEEEIQTNNE